MEIIEQVMAMPRIGDKAPEFTALNCQLVGLSIDGLYSHIAWLRTIKEKIEFKGMKNMEVKFPLIEDITMEVAKKYGMTCTDWFFCTKPLPIEKVKTN